MFGRSSLRQTHAFHIVSAGTDSYGGIFPDPTGTEFPGLALLSFPDVEPLLFTLTTCRKGIGQPVMETGNRHLVMPGGLSLVIKSSGPPTVCLVIGRK